jgi:hypothetical protein
MRVTNRISVVALFLAFGTMGCASTRQARYVYQDGQFGVVGIPENTDLWPSFYRQKADELMKEHFPEGYEIVRAEEVDAGSRTLTVNGTNTAELDAGTFSPILKLGKIGRTATRTQADNVKIKECRILYKRAGTETQPGFAALATLNPEPYVDPNAEARPHLVAKPKPPEPGPVVVEAPKTGSEPEKAPESPATGPHVATEH